MKNRTLGKLAFATIIVCASPAAADDMIHHHMHGDSTPPNTMGAPDHAKAPEQGDAPMGLTKTNNGVEVMLHLTPGEPKAKASAKAELMLTDTESQTPANVEAVSVKWVMVKMFHEVARQQLKADANGRFGANVTFPMTGDYSAIVTTEHNGKPVTVTFPFRVAE